MVKKEHITFVLFGGTGDLVKRKLVPAFARMVHDGKISRRSTIIGVARSEMGDDDYKKLLVESEEDKVEKKHIQDLNVRYLKADFSKPGGLKELQPLVSVCEPGTRCSRIYYLATSYKFFGKIILELKKSGLNKKAGGYSRIVFEKPFGRDLDSSIKLDKEIHKAFSEKDVYRLDHYLAKESVRNLITLKNSNKVLGAILNNKYVESIEIIADESIGVEKRLGYYNGSGAVKDMIQSHLLQVLSMVLMDVPRDISMKSIEKEKVKILKKLEVVKKGNLFGRYRSYKKELKSAGLEDNGVETFASVVLNCKSKKWDGVPLILRTGKKLKKKFGEIKIKLKTAKEFDARHGGVRGKEILIGIYPRQKVDIVMSGSERRCTNCVSDVNFNFCPECNFEPNTVDDYAVLLGEVVDGEKMLFASSDVVRESWKVAENICKIKGRAGIVEYKDGEDVGKIIST
jgi:glucose-6-phosphate 1-dehydrogenase